MIGYLRGVIEMTKAESSSSAKPEKQNLIDQTLLDACIHCGLCLPACPTYLATGREVESPRGRIYLLNQWQTGAQDLTPRLAEHIDSCLGCLGCQTACPSGVQYEKILSAARPEIARFRNPLTRALMRFSFQNVLPNYKFLRVSGVFLRGWQAVKGGVALNFVAQKIPFKPLRTLALWQSYLPRILKHEPLARQSWNVGKKEGTVQVFAGCIMDIFYNQVNQACVRLLKRQSQVVEVPEQTCCGALAFHAGEDDIARSLAKRNIEFFEKRPGEIVVTSAGCGAMLKEYPELFKRESDAAEWKERAEAFSARIKDLSEFLAKHNWSEGTLENAQTSGSVVAYHAACHLAHAQNVRVEPAALLEQLAKAINVKRKRESAQLKLVPLKDAEHCCGSAGIYNLVHPDLSDTILDKKMEYIAASGANIIVTSNPGCLLQLETGARRKGLRIRILHLAQLLDEAYCK
jgi:glycolate oxidase iron-sulfur subunit